MTAWYNEIDPFAAAWLRELIAEGHIAPGVVDERSILDVRPSDLRGFTQCHFFAGIGVWSYAARLAGWPDDRPLWTGSCPCQPFSSAGQGGGFDDERHLWPFWHYLIEIERPSVVFGEQVASKDGLAWLDLVQADMEGTRYAAGALDTCSAGSGAPHIRQRLRFAATELEYASGNEWLERWTKSGEWRPLGGCRADELGHHHHQGLEGFGRGHQTEIGRIGAAGSTSSTGELGRMAIAEEGRRSGRSGHATGQWAAEFGLGDDGRFNRLAHDDDDGCAASSGPGIHDAEHHAQSRGFAGRWAGPTNGLWRDVDWLFCRDGKWRPVEPGTFPLAHGAAARVGRLRGYGNAVDAEATRVFIEAFLEAEAASFQPLRQIDSVAADVTPFAELLG